ncbi:hypothetical protein K1719_038338 [Acacia pycnantha]|nr:hypothetical protein K1719_038338 [Acacia pycnantha]
MSFLFLVLFQWRKDFPSFHLLGDGTDRLISVTGSLLIFLLSFQTQGRESIAAKVVANLITLLVTFTRSGQSMGYIDIPVDHVLCQPVILDYLASKMISSNDLVVVSPDVGGTVLQGLVLFSKKLSDAPLVIIDKRCHGHNLAEVMKLIGDVKGKVA